MILNRDSLARSLQLIVDIVRYNRCLAQYRSLWLERIKINVLQLVDNLTKLSSISKMTVQKQIVMRKLLRFALFSSVIMEISLTYIQNLDRKNPEFSAPAITFYAIGQVKYTVWQSLWVIVVISLAMCIILAKMKYHL